MELERTKYLNLIYDLVVQPPHKAIPFLEHHYEKSDEKKLFYLRLLECEWEAKEAIDRGLLTWIAVREHILKQEKNPNIFERNNYEFIRWGITSIIAVVALYIAAAKN